MPALPPPLTFSVKYWIPVVVLQLQLIWMRREELDCHPPKSAYLSPDGAVTVHWNKVRDYNVLCLAN